MEAAQWRDTARIEACYDTGTTEAEVGKSAIDNYADGSYS